MCESIASRFLFLVDHNNFSLFQIIIIFKSHNSSVFIAVNYKILASSAFIGAAPKSSRDIFFRFTFKPSSSKPFVKSLTSYDLPHAPKKSMRLQLSLIPFHFFVSPLLYIFIFKHS